MTAPSISVILPNYNHSAYLPNAVEQLARQSRWIREILVIDDASTDQSVSVIERLAAQHPIVRLHRNPRNLGIVANMNLGLDHVEGPLIYYAAADDQVFPVLFERAVPLMEQYPQAGMACAGLEWHEEATGYLYYTGVRMGEPEGYASPDRLAELETAGRLRLTISSTVLRKDRLVRAGGFRPELRWFTDWFYLYTTAFRDGVCLIPEPGARLNIHVKSYSSAGQQTAEHTRVLIGLLDGLNALGDAPEAERIRRCGSLFQFGFPMFRLVTREAKYRRFLTGAFCRKSLWMGCKLTVKRYLPAGLARWYYRTFLWPRGRE